MFCNRVQLIARALATTLNDIKLVLPIGLEPIKSAFVELNAPICREHNSFAIVVVPVDGIEPSSELYKSPASPFMLYRLIYKTIILGF